MGKRAKGFWSGLVSLPVRDPFIVQALTLLEITPVEFPYTGNQGPEPDVPLPRRYQMYRELTRLRAGGCSHANGGRRQRRPGDHIMVHPPAVASDGGGQDGARREAALDQIWFISSAVIRVDFRARRLGRGGEDEHRHDEDGQADHARQEQREVALVSARPAQNGEQRGSPDQASPAKQWAQGRLRPRGGPSAGPRRGPAGSVQSRWR